jgi:uncharacterized DUF497 family protein
MSAMDPSPGAQEPSVISRSLTLGILSLHVEYEWDPAKSERNRHVRALPFDLAADLFDGPILEQIDERRDYGEERVQAIGIIDGVIMQCVYTDRPSGVRRIISLRRAKRKERHAFRSAFPE